MFLTPRLTLEAFSCRNYTTDLDLLSPQAIQSMQHFLSFVPYGLELLT
jgi:hypothetical protein